MVLVIDGANIFYSVCMFDFIMAYNYIVLTRILK